MRTVTSSELRQGQIVHCHGMRVELDRPMETYEGSHGQVFHSLGLVLNRDEVPSSTVPHSFTAHEGEHRWRVQGNDNARWYVEDPS